MGRALLLAALLAGCASEPRLCEEPMRALYVVNHGWHSGIVVERAELLNKRPGLGPDLGQARYVEIGWGEEDYYQARDPHIGMALSAVLWINSSVLQVVPFDEPPQRYFPHSEIREVRTDQAGYEATLGFIAESFKRTPSLDRRGQSLYGQGWFYRGRDSFHLFNTCNRWTARALEAARCVPASERQR